MKFDLVIKDASGEELAQVFAALGAVSRAASASMSTAVIPPMPATAGDDGDESSDTPAVVGALDGDGLPHDNRIHSEPAKITTKGVWRKKRGVTDQLVSQVEAELRARVQQPATTVAPVQPVMQQPQVPQAMPAPVAAVQPVYTPQPLPPAPVAPTYVPQPQVPQMPQAMPAPPPPMPMPPAGIDFQGFMQGLTAGMQRRDANGNPFIDGAYLATVVQTLSTAFGRQLSAITDIQNDPQMIEYAVKVIAADGRWQ